MLRVFACGGPSQPRCAARRPPPHSKGRARAPAARAAASQPLAGAETEAAPVVPELSGGNGAGAAPLLRSTPIRPV